MLQIEINQIAIVIAGCGIIAEAAETDQAHEWQSLCLTPYHIRAEIAFLTIGGGVDCSGIRVNRKYPVAC